MNKPFVLIVLLSLVLVAAPADADSTGPTLNGPANYTIYLPLVIAPLAPTVYVDDNLVCDGHVPCVAHPQDAVNRVAPGGHILVYPGTYASRTFPCSGCSGCDSCAPPLIVYKDNLTITAVDTEPAHTVIETTMNCWSNPSAVAKSTAGGVHPVSGTEPNTISIVASGVTISGFTIRRPNDVPAGGDNSVLIGGLYLGYGIHGESLGYGSNTLVDNVIDGGPGRMSGSVSIWHSSHNVVRDNLIKDPNLNAIQVFDGFTAEEVHLPFPSQDNHVERNTIQDNPATTNANNTCIFVGAWTENKNLLTNNAGTIVQGNDCALKGLAAAFTDGSIVFTKNTGVGWACRGYADGAVFLDNVGPWMPVPVDPTCGLKVTGMTH